MAGTILLVVLCVGVLWWARREFADAARDATPLKQRRISLYYGLILAGLGIEFGGLALVRVWPVVPVWLIAAAMLPALATAFGVRFHHGFAARLLARLG